MIPLRISAVAFVAAVLLGCGRGDGPPKGDDPGLPVAAGDNPAGSKLRYYKRVVALCVGINKYRSVGIDEVESCEEDAKAVAALFRDRFGYEVTELIGSQATRAAVLSRIDRARADLGERDALIVYFAGHGQVIDLPSFGRAGYLVPYDADLDLTDKSRPKRWEEQAIEMRELAKSVEACNAQHVLFVVDSCFSGFMAHRGLNPALGEMMARRSRCVIAATTDRQTSTRNPETKHGYFTGALLKQLGTGEPKCLTDVFTRARDEVVKTSTRRMLPQRGNFGEEDGEFVFIPSAFPAEGVTQSMEYIRDQAIQRAARRTTAEEYYHTIDAVDYRNGPKRADFEKVWEARYERFRTNASNGDTLALCALALCQAKGIGTEANPAEAYRSARLAYESGRDEGLYPLSYCYTKGIGTALDIEAAMKVSLSRVRDITNPSPFQLIALHDMNLAALARQRPRDSDRRFRGLKDLMSKALDGGVSIAALRQVTCWQCLRQPIPEEERAKLLPVVAKLAESGNPVALYHHYYLIGTGAKKLTDEERDAAFLGVVSAAEQGYAPAQIAVATEQYGRKPLKAYLGLKENPWRAYLWAQRAGQLGHADGYKIAAMINFYKDIDIGTPERAVACWRRAIEMDPNDKEWAEWMAGEFKKAGLR